MSIDEKSNDTIKEKTGVLKRLRSNRTTGIGQCYTLLILQLLSPIYQSGVLFNQSYTSPVPSSDTILLFEILQ